jgi:SAM-dependent methyltransferase
MIARLGWRVYGVAALALNPHAFFTRLAALDWYGGMLRAWVTGLDLGAPRRVLEAGCSGGTLAGDLAGRGHVVVAFDRSTRAVRFARARCATNRIQPSYLAATAEHLPLPKGHFERVLAASLLNVVSDPAAVVAELARVTAPAGRVSFLFPTPRMTPAAVRTFIRRHGLSGFSAEALSLWATLATKLDEEVALKLLMSAPLKEARCTHFLGGMVSAASGWKVAGDATGRS